MEDNVNQDVTVYFVRTLGFAVFVVLVGALSILVILGWSEGEDLLSKAENIAPVLSTVAISSGVLIAILTFSRDRKRISREREENRSRILLEQAESGLNEAYELLRDRNNNRIIWVRAARALLQARELAADIVTPEYARAYRLFEHRMRNNLYGILTTVDEDSQERKPLPPQFFYGAPDWDRDITLDDIAVETSQRIKVRSVSIDNVMPEPDIKPLSTRSVVAIYDFLEFPSEYADPLDEVKIWEDDWSECFGVSQGAKKYVAHRRATLAINGKLHRNHDSDR